MNNLLILGAGVYQVPLIRVAHDCGYRTVVASIPGDYPGIGLCDEFHPIDTTDSAGIVSLARRICPAGVVTTGTDVALYSLAAACDALDLPGPSTHSAKLATNKKLMKDAFLAEGVRSAKYVEVYSADEAKSIWNTFGTPLIFKCVDKSGSRGIAKAWSGEEAGRACAYALSATNLGYVIAEQIIEGHEIGVDGYVDENGEIAFIAPHDKVVWNNGKTDIPIGHRMNEDFIRNCLSNTDLLGQVKKTTDALEMRSCFFNMDVMLVDGEAWIIEAGVRTGATCIPEVMSAYYGFDFYKTILAASVGSETSFFDSPVVGAAEGRLLFAKQPSVLTGVLESDDSGITVSFDYPIGSLLPGFISGNNRCGQVVGVCESPEQLSFALDEVTKRIEETCFKTVSL